MNKTVLIASLLLMAVWTGPVAAQDDPNKPDEAVTKPVEPLPDDPKLVEVGKELLAGLDPLKPGEQFESYFELKRGPENIFGFMSAKIKGVPGQKGKGQEIQYDMEMYLQFPTGAATHVVVTARLRPNFEPIKVLLKRNFHNEQDEEILSEQGATVGKDKITLTLRGADVNRSEDVPLPEKPFIYGIELLAQKVDFAKHESFLVREFDLVSGKAASITFWSSRSADGAVTAFSRTASNVDSYQFWFDKDGKLIRWGEPSMPFLFVSTTKERVNQLKAAMEPPPIEGTRSNLPVAPLFSKDKP